MERAATVPDLDRLNLEKEKYTYRYQYETVGHQFVHGNVVIRVFRFHEEDLNNSHPINRDIFAPTETNLIDPSGAWIVEALVRIEDTSNSKIVEAAKRELAQFRYVSCLRS